MRLASVMPLRPRTLALVLALAACAPPPAPPAPPTKPAAPPVSGKTVRYVFVDPEPLVPLVKVDLVAARKWAADPANARAIRPRFRHILAKASPGDAASEAAARKKIDGLLARLVAGEDFAKLALESDDPGSATKGGAYPGEMVDNFVEDVKRAYDALRPGTFTREPLKTTFGWHIVMKDAIDDEAMLASYASASSVKAAETIAKGLRERLHHVDGEGVAGAVKRAFVDVLGAAPPTLPEVARVPADAPGSVLASDCQDLGAIARSGTTRAQAFAGILVATLTDDPLDPGEIEGGRCSAQAENEKKALLEHLRERLQRQAEPPSAPPDTTGWIATETRPARPFEVLRIDDTVDAMRVVTEATLPSATKIRFEVVPAGDSDKPVRVHFAALDLEPNEKGGATLARARKWLATVKHPKGTAFVLEPTYDEDAKPTALRTLLVREPAVLDERDVEGVTTTTWKGEPRLRIELRPEGAKRFADATREWTMHRMAILFDGVVDVAPIVKSAIIGGTLEVIPPGDTAEQRAANAARLARALGRKR